MAKAQYIPVHKDVGEIKQKFIGGLTKRQTICFSIGFAIGIPMFFLTKNAGLELAIFIMGITAAPAIVCGLYKKNGFYFEERIKNMIRFFKNAQIRTYQSENLYIQIENEIEYTKLKRKLHQHQKMINTKKKR